MSTVIWSPTEAVQLRLRRWQLYGTLANKELRQTLPLVAMLAGVSAFLFALLSASTASESTLQMMRGLLAFTPAVLFAVGAGSILVGQEKEDRTIAWLSWLPVRPIELVVIKWVVAAAVTAALLIAGAMVMPDRWDWVGSYSTSSTLSIVSISAQALLLLSAGLTTAWVVENAFAALLSVIPIAITPWLLSATAASASQGWLPEDENRLYVLLTAMAAALMTASAIWAGCRNLHGGAKVFFPNPWAIGDDVSATAPQAGHDLWPAPKANRLSAMTGLYWSHHRWFLGLIAMLLIVAATVLTYGLRGDRAMDQLGGGVALAALAPVAAAWLGVAAYNGDGSPRRLRFLADRGVSPMAIWASRHLPPVTWLAAWSMLVFGMLSFVRWGQDDRLPSLSLLGWVGAMLSVYGIAQFIAMVFRPIAASTLLSVVLSLLGLVAIVTAPQTLGTPLLLVAAAAALPCIASMVMTSDYVEDSRGVRYWSTAAAAAGGFVVLLGWPVVPAVLVPANVRGGAVARWEHFQPHPNHHTIVRLASWSPEFETLGDIDQSSTEEVVAMIEAIPSDAERMLRVIDETSDQPRPLRPTDRLRGVYQEPLLDHLTLWSTRFRSHPSDPNARRQLEAWLTGIGEVVAALRRDDSLMSQSIADVLEIIQVREITRLRALGLVDHTYASNLSRQLADRSLRQRSRRLAVLTARQREIKQMRQGTYDLDFGDDGPQTSLTTPVGLWSFVKPKRVEELTDALLTLNAGGTPELIEGTRRRLHHLQFGDAIAFERGPYGPSFHDTSSSPAPVGSRERLVSRLPVAW